MTEYHLSDDSSIEDHILTYIAIAKDLGILSDDPEDEKAFIQMLLGDNLKLKGN